MEITRIALGENYELIGIQVEGTSQEFYKFDGSIIEHSRIRRIYSIKVLKERGFKNSQVRIDRYGIKELGDFRLNEIQAIRIDGDRYYVIDNDISLTKRVTVDGELVGFEVKLPDGKLVKYSYRDVVQLATWCKPNNFVVRNTENGKVIAGKANVMKLEELPEEARVSKERAARLEGDTRKKELVTNIKTGKLTGEEYSSLGLVELYELIRSCEGLIINLPDEDYTAMTSVKYKPGQEFNALGVGEIGNPSLDYGESKLNANTMFKKVGTVMIGDSFGTMPIYTYTWTKKSVFADGEHHIERLGIGVTEDTVVTLVNSFGAEIVRNEIRNTAVTNPIKAVTGRKDLVFFEIATEKLKLMSKRRASTYIMDNKALYDTVIKLNTLKILKSFLADAVKFTELNMTKEEKVELRKSAKLFGIFSRYDEETLRSIIDAGINIYTGAYTKVETKWGVEYSKPVSRDMTIQFEIDGLRSAKISYMSVLSFMMGEGNMPDMCSNTHVELVKLIEGQPNNVEKINTIRKYKEKVEKDIFLLKKAVWNHKAAMYTLGDGKGLMTLGSAYWMERNTRGINKIYECVEPGCEGLLLKLKNISMV